MLKEIVDLMIVLVALFDAVVWIASLVNWDGKYHCKKEDCYTCPFNNGTCSYEKKLHERDK